MAGLIPSVWRGDLKAAAYSPDTRSTTAFASGLAQSASPLMIARCWPFRSTMIVVGKPAGVGFRSVRKLNLASW
jgi:hypothetical protein